MGATDDGEQLHPMWQNHSLWAAPITVIKENFQHRELIQRLIRRDLDSRFRAPLLGYLWILKP